MATNAPGSCRSSWRRRRRRAAPNSRCGKRSKATAATAASQALPENTQAPAPPAAAIANAAAHNWAGSTNRNTSLKCAPACCVYTAR
ncbi:Uncharacterised protein [Bordetella pertussis]|nr:Uncharacterised protein [Bordetella pertussis]CFP53950.1 Uncharacterised protein [Bordetella pertussis]CPJ61610.1 Uncharacterised protein [Bordetella pertussis]CPL55104.1 Uncharacterised protein [Bordetella pertussis]